MTERAVRIALFRCQRHKLALVVRWRLCPEGRSTEKEGLLIVLWRASCSRRLALRCVSNSAADMKCRATRGVGAGTGAMCSGEGIASRTSWRMTALPNSLDTLYAAWMRDTAEADSCG